MSSTCLLPRWLPPDPVYVAGSGRRAGPDRVRLRHPCRGRARSDRRSRGDHPAGTQRWTPRPPPASARLWTPGTGHRRSEPMPPSAAEPRLRVEPATVHDMRTPVAAEAGRRGRWPQVRSQADRPAVHDRAPSASPHRVAARSPGVGLPPPSTGPALVSRARTCLSERSDDHCFGAWRQRRYFRTVSGQRPRPHPLATGRPSGKGDGRARYSSEGSRARPSSSGSSPRTSCASWV